jgi:hypothetical protein
LQQRETTERSVEAARPWTAVLAEVAGDRTKAVLGFAGGRRRVGAKRRRLRKFGGGSDGEARRTTAALMVADIGRGRGGIGDPVGVEGARQRTQEQNRGGGSCRSHPGGPEPHHAGGGEGRRRPGESGGAARLWRARGSRV